MDWLPDAVSWLDEQLREHRITRTGAVTEARSRPWGTVWRADTTHGPVWLKAPCAETVFEVALYELLHLVVPDHVLPPLGVDVERGWVLLPDGGTVLGERFEHAELIDALTGVLPQYGQLQRDLAPHADRMLALGVTDMRAAMLPQRFDEAVDATGRWIKRHGDAEGRELHRRVTAMRGTFVSWCERLGSGVVPASLDHNDLHPWNVFYGDGKARFYDWGDAVLAHPFASMLVGLGFLGAAADDPAVRRLRDAYLEAWTDRAPLAELIDELDLACRVAAVARSLVWERALRPAGAAAAVEFTRAPWDHLRALLADSWLAVRS